MNLQLSDIGNAIQLAIAPVFLLAGVCIVLIVMTNRLGRLIDRTRVLEERQRACDDGECLGELRVLHRSAELINIGIAASTSCGLLVCIVIAMLFLADTANLPLDHYIALCFVSAMLALTVGFACFMREVFISSSFARMRQLKAIDSAAADGASITPH